MWFFQLSGLSLMLISVAGLLAIISNRAIALNGGRDLSPLIPVVALGFLIGLGLVRKYDWAIYVFGVGSAVVGLLLATGSLFCVPFPWALINVFFGVLFVLPGISALARYRGQRKEASGGGV